MLRSTRLPLSLSPLQPCLDRLLGVGDTAPIEWAEELLVELMSLRELFPFDVGLGMPEATGLRKIGS